MKAQKIYEKLGFERGQDPKTAMDIGQARDKKKLIALMSDPSKYPSNDDAKAQYKYMIEVIMKPTTRIQFMEKHEDISGTGRILVTLPPSLINAFFFEALSKSVVADHDAESYVWDNPTDNTLNIWINS